MFAVGSRKDDGCRGLTLLELLFAMTVLAFVLLGVAGMFPSALRSVAGGGQATKATALAQEMLDMLCTEPFDLLILAPSQNGYNGFDTRSAITGYTCPVTAGASTATYKKMRWKCDLSPAAAQTTGQGLPDGYGTVAVACVNPDGTANGTTPCPTDLRRVTVTVFWGRQGAQSVQLVTHVARTE